jgi:proteasome alpha subunit
VADSPSGDQLYRLSYDGTITDHPDFLVMGGQAEAVATTLRSSFSAGLALPDAITLAVSSLGSTGGDNGGPRVLTADSLEVAVLDRNRGQRKFRRITGVALTSLLPTPETPTPPLEEPADPAPDSAVT